MPAFFPRCHILHEVGSLFIPAPGHPRFIEVSPEGIIKCIRNCGICNNQMQIPIGTMALELKCPYTSIHNKTMLPVHYQPPQYYCCQLLSQLMAMNTNVMVFGSWSPESMAISFVDKCDKTWKPLFGLARELFADGNLSKPSTLHGQSNSLQPSLKTFSDHKSTFVAEIPILNGTNNNSETRYLPPDFLYQYIQDISSECVNGNSVNKDIFELCQESYKIICKAHHLQRQKASEVLLFVCTDSDREFNKGKPTSIPVAYALKGRSIRISTAQKMINKVHDQLKEHET